MEKILVTGAGGPAGRSLTALLAQRRVPLVVTDSRPFADFDLPFYQVPLARAPGFLHVIRQIAIAEHIDWIIPTVSEELPVFAGGWQPGGPAVLVGQAGAVAMADDKYLTALVLSQKGVAVPRFMLPSQAHSPEAVACTIGWPCVSKPRVGRGGREVTIHEEDDFNAAAALSDAYILQEYASGADYAPELFVHPHQHAMTLVVLEKTELKEGRVGNAVSVRRVEAPDVAEVAQAAAHAAGLTGPLDIDIRRRADGQPVVLEINARFGANLAHAPAVFEAALAYLQNSEK
jgi:carbamoylphosphate synthase large subunit